MQSNFKIRSSDPVTTNEEEIIRLRTRLDSHIDDYRAHILEDERRYIQDLKKQEVMSNNIERLIESQKLQAESMKWFIEAGNAATFLQRTLKWLSGFAVIGAAIVWYNDFFTK